MSEKRQSVVLAPVLAWAGLNLALAATATYAFIPHAPAKLWVALAISFVKALLIGLVFMRLTRSSGLARLTAAVGLIWLSLLFILGFADVLTRLKPGPG